MSRFRAAVAAFVILCSATSPTFAASVGTAFGDDVPVDPTVVVWDDPDLEAIYSPELKARLADENREIIPGEEISLASRTIKQSAPALRNLAVDNQGCDDTDGTWAGIRFQGNQYGDGVGGTNAEIFGVRAVVDVNGNDFGTCDKSTASPFTDQGAVASWIALTPGPDNTGDYEGFFGLWSGNAIVQIGSLMCNETIQLGDACESNPTHPKMFWAAGGCGISAAWARSMGETDVGPHQYWMSTVPRTGSHTVNGKAVHSGTHLDILIGHSDANRLNDAWDVMLWSGDGGLNCWFPDSSSEGDGNRSLQAQVMGERHDKGDSNGNCNSCSPSGHSFFESNRYQDLPTWPSNSWNSKTFPTTPSPGGCNYDDQPGPDDGGCDVANADPDSFSIWDD